MKQNAISSSRALWNRSGLDLASDEVLAQILDRGEIAAWHFGVACMGPDFVKTFYSVSQGKIVNRGGIAGFLAVECGRFDP